MADDTIRPHDPFSGHETPAVADDPGEPKTVPEKPAPPAEVVEPEPVKKPVRRGRRARRTPSAAEMEQARAKVARK